MRGPVIGSREVLRSWLLELVDHLGQRLRHNGVRTHHRGQGTYFGFQDVHPLGNAAGTNRCHRGDLAGGDWGVRTAGAAKLATTAFCWGLVELGWCAMNRFRPIFLKVGGTENSGRWTKRSTRSGISLAGKHSASRRVAASRLFLTLHCLPGFDLPSGVLYTDTLLSYLPHTCYPRICPKLNKKPRPRFL
jgi:hypothetical protein